MPSKKPEQLAVEELTLLEFRQEDLFNELITHKQNLKEVQTKQEEVAKIFEQLVDKFNKIKVQDMVEIKHYRDMADAKKVYQELIKNQSNSSVEIKKSITRSEQELKVVSSRIELLRKRVEVSYIKGKLLQFKQ